MNERDPKLKDGEMRVAGYKDDVYIEEARDGYWEPYIESGEASAGAYRRFPTIAAAAFAIKRIQEMRTKAP